MNSKRPAAKPVRSDKPAQPENARVVQDFNIEKLYLEIQQNDPMAARVEYWKNWLQSVDAKG